MHDSISTTGLSRPRVRRGLGVVVGAALLVTPLAAAPAASAQGLSNVTPQSLAALIAQLPSFLAQIVAGLGNTLAHPLGEAVPSSVPPGAGYADGLSSTLTTVIAPLAGGPGKATTKAKVKASLKKGKVAKVRWVK